MLSKYTLHCGLSSGVGQLEERAECALLAKGATVCCSARRRGVSVVLGLVRVLRLSVGAHAFVVDDVSALLLA